MRFRATMVLLLVSVNASVAAQQATVREGRLEAVETRLSAIPVSELAVYEGTLTVCTGSNVSCQFHGSDNADKPTEWTIALQGLKPGQELVTVAYQAPMVREFTKFGYVKVT